MPKSVTFCHDELNRGKTYNVSIISRLLFCDYVKTIEIREASMKIRCRVSFHVIGISNHDTESIASTQRDPSKKGTSDEISICSMLPEPK